MHAPLPALLLVAVAFLSGCAQTTSSNAQSFIDPAWKGERYPAVLVEVKSNDLRERSAIERSAVGALNEAGVFAVAGMDVFLPTRTYTASERRNLARSQHVSAVITIEPGRKTIERSYTPPMKHYPYGGFGWGSGGHSAVGVGVGLDTGLLLEEPIVTYSVSLAPLSTEKIVWVGDFATRGPTGMDFNTVGKRFAGYLVRRLQDDGMI